jgi:hypothetical protein
MANRENKEEYDAPDSAEDKELGKCKAENLPKAVHSLPPEKVSNCRRR